MIDIALAKRLRFASPVRKISRGTVGSGATLQFSGRCAAM